MVKLQYLKSNSAIRHSFTHSVKETPSQYTFSNIYSNKRVPKPIANTRIGLFFEKRGRTNAKEIPLRYLFCVEVFEGEERRGVRIRVYHLSHTRKTAVKDAEGADAVGRRSLTAGLSLRAHQRQKPLRALKQLRFKAFFLAHRQLWRQLSTIFFCPLFFYSFFRSWAGCKSASSYFFKNSTISLHYLKKRRRPHECGL